MNKPDLIELIEYLEYEQKSLEKQKNDCLREWDYEGAHYLSIALGEIGRQLRTLYNLNDPSYYKKQRLENYKSFFEADIKETNSDHLKQVYEARKKEIEDQIQQLNNKTKDQKTDGQEFDDAIYELIEKRIAGFTFHLKKEDKLYLDFSLYDDQTMLITTNSLDLPNSYPRLHIKHKLSAFGFIFNDKKNCMEYFYELKTFKNSFEIKKLVSRIIFDVLYYEELDNPAFIEKY